jgi:uncharacterized protein YlaI
MVYSIVFEKFEKIWLSGTLNIIRKPKTVEQQTRKNSNFPVRGILCKKCKHTRQKKPTIFRGKEKKRYFYVHRRPILYQTENHDH